MPRNASPMLPNATRWSPTATRLDLHHRDCPCTHGRYSTANNLPEDALQCLSGSKTRCGVGFSTSSPYELQGVFDMSCSTTLSDNWQRATTLPTETSNGLAPSASLHVRRGMPMSVVTNFPIPKRTTSSTYYAVRQLRLRSVMFPASRQKPGLCRLSSELHGARGKWPTRQAMSCLR